jgi:Ser/Thr protein kinase RdoA (MazF antagonist)
MSRSRVPVEILRRHYSRLGQERSTALPVNAAEINSHNWFVHFGDDPVPRFVLKIKEVEDASLCPEWESAVRSYITASSKVDLLPRLLPTDQGEFFAWDDGALIRLSEYRSGTSFVDSADALRSGGVALARVHRALEGGRARATSPLYVNLSDAEKSVARAQVQDGGDKSEFVREAFRWLTEEAPALYAELDALEPKAGPRGPVHHDFAPQNVLWKGKEVAAVLDPDSLVVDFQMQAVAFAASRFSPKSVAWDFLAGYHAVIPLELFELRLFPAFVRREAIRRLNWILRVNLILQRDCWRSDFSKHARNIEMSRRWDSEFAVTDEALRKQLSR